MGRGKRRSFLAYFYLVRQVRMPSRPYLVPSRDKLAEIVPARLQGVLSRLVSG
jgi:hypothetical protein